MFPVVDVVDVCTGVAGVVEVEFIWRTQTLNNYQSDSSFH